ncbi:MAG TPA: PTS sugar transporter subunit IIC [Nitrospirota bacterium]
MPTLNLHIVLAVLVTAVVGGLIGLDRTAFGQFMVSQPIVACPLVGWMVGDSAAGFVIGAALELIWVLDMPVGTFVPANATISAISATAMAVLASPGKASLPVIGASVLLTTVLAPVTMKVDGLVRKWNSRLAERARADQRPDAGRRLARIHLFGLVAFFLKSFVLLLVFVPAGIWAVMLFQHLPENVHRAMALFVKLLPLLGVALVARKLSMKAVDLFFLGGFVFSAATAQAFRAPALVIILLTALAGLLGARYRAQRSS